MKKTIIIIILAVLFFIIGSIYYKNFIQNENFIEKESNKTQQFDNYIIDEKQGTFKINLGGGGR